MMQKFSTIRDIYNWLLTNPPQDMVELDRWVRLYETVIIYCDHPLFISIGKNEKETLNKYKEQYGNKGSV